MSSPLRIEKNKPVPEPDPVSPAVAAEPQRKPAPAPPSEPTPAAPAAPAKKGSARKVIILSILAILLVVGGVMGYRTVVFYGHHATTDDAQTDGHIDPVLPRVSGYVSEVRVQENQQVQAGDVLVVVDPSDLQAKVDQEQAALLNAEAAVAVARANVEAARTRRVQAGADVARYQALYAKEEVSARDYDAVKATSDASAAQLDATQRGVAAAQAQVAQHRATLNAAKLQISYATVKAPAAGMVSKKNVEVGQFVQAGQPLLAIVQGRDVWVTANFKETQLSRMRPGQPAEIEVDAYPGVVFHGKVESLSAATGARFSLLPPDNASGNFTKVVQRVPVKIVFTDKPDPRRPLRVGLNASVTVNLD